MKTTLLTLLAIMLATTVHAYDYTALASDPTATGTFIEKVFAHSSDFYGLKLLDHDATFTHNIADSKKVLRNFYSIEIVYAIDQGYGYSSGPFSLRYVVIPSPKTGKYVGMEFFSEEEYWTFFYTVSGRPFNGKD